MEIEEAAPKMCMSQVAWLSRLRSDMTVTRRRNSMAFK